MVRRVVVGLLMLACAAGVLAGIAQIRLDTGVSSFLPADDPALQAIQEKAHGFGGDPVVVLLESKEPRQLLIDRDQLPRLAKLEGRLTKLPGAAQVYGPGTVVNQIASGSRNILAAIGGRRATIVRLAEDRARAEGKSAVQAKAEGKRALDTFNRRYGSLIVRGLPAGLPTVYNPNFVQSVIFDSAGNPKRQWRFVVPTPKSAAIVVRAKDGLDEAGNRRLTESVRQLVHDAGLSVTRTTVTGVPVVSNALADQVRSDAPWLLVLAVLGCSAVLLTIPRAGRWRDRLWPLGVMSVAAAIPLSVFGWSHQPISLGVLALLPILLGIGSDFPLYLVQGVHRRRVLASGCASAAAAACLVLCPLPIVRQLGLTLTAGIVLVILLSMLLRTRIAAPPADASARGFASGKPPARAVRVSVLIAVGAVAGLGWFVLPRIDVAADPQRLAAGLSAIDDAEHVQQAMGSSAELNIVLSGDNVLRPDVLQWQRKANDAVVSAYGDRARPIISGADLLRFLGQNPTRQQVTAGMDLVPRYLASSVIRSDHKQAVLAYGMQLEDISQQRITVSGIRSTLPAPPPGIHADIVGTPVAAGRAYDIVSESRYVTNASGILAAGVVLFFGLRRRSDALRAVLAGVLATGWGLAIMWATGAALTPLTVTLGALTTVVGCEFVVMLASAHRSRDRRVLWSVAGACANSAIAYLVLTVSGMHAMRDFGLVMFASVALSYLAALLVVRMLAPRDGWRPTDVRTETLRADTATEVRV